MENIIFCRFQAKIDELIRREKEREQRIQNLTKTEKFVVQETRKFSFSSRCFLFDSDQ